MIESTEAKGRTQKLLLAGAAVATVGAVATLMTIGGLRASTAMTPLKVAAPPVVSTVSPNPIANTPVNVADIVERVGQAVVSIEVSQKIASVQQRTPFGPFEEFFKRFDTPEHPQNQRPTPRHHQARGVGSGFIIDKNGYIVTNNHVINGADQITVSLTDGRKFKAQLVGADEKTDLALLKIEAEKPLPAVKFGRSDTMRVGDWVVTIGNPFGLGQTVTTGIVSARHRNIGAGPFDDFLQIDAPINKGNSGGPAFNLRGEVIGVNTAIFSPSGGNVGIGFAIPSLQAQKIVADLKSDGVVQRGWLGVHIQEVNEVIAQGLDLDIAKGALVAKVMPGSPAAKSGLKPGDVILNVNGGSTKTMRELPKQIAALRSGDKADMTIWRNGKEKTLSVVIGKTPTIEQLASAANPANVDDGNIIGMRLAGLDDQTRRTLKLNASQNGVVVADVDVNSFAARAGLRRGDVISTIGNSEVATPSEAARKIEQAKHANRRAVLLHVTRGTVNGITERFVAVPLRDA